MPVSEMMIVSILCGLSSAVVVVALMAGAIILARSLRTISTLAGMNFRAAERERRDEMDHTERMTELRECRTPDAVASVHAQERARRLDLEKTVDCEAMERPALKPPRYVKPVPDAPPTPVEDVDAAPLE